MQLIDSSKAAIPVTISSRRQELPFTLKDLRDAIPDRCFEPDTFRSLAYFFLDIGIIAGLYGLAAFFDSWLLFPLFWLAQGTMFWALFVVGHDCGHGSFSKHKWLNSLVGHLSHSPILVPYHGWRITHRHHHANTGNMDTDESWFPVPQSEYEAMDWLVKIMRFQLLLLAYPLYLFVGTRGRNDSHFLPSNGLFKPSEKRDIVTSTICWGLMIALLGVLGLKFGLLFLVKYYLMPYLVFVVWLDLVTYLHHTVPEIPWYRNDSWYFLKGALSTIDHDYGFINNIHHNIGTHVAHHIFSNMPHYRLKTATEAIKPILGDYYHVSNEPIWTLFWRSVRSCHYVADEGSVLYYQADKS
ncbi:MAG: fatty acid desaturase [Cyanobacteria bacterium J06629_9]